MVNDDGHCCHNAFNIALLVSLCWQMDASGLYYTHMRHQGNKINVAISITSQWDTRPTILLTQNHDSGVIWAFGRHKSPATVLFFQQISQARNNQSKSRQYWPIVRWIHRARIGESVSSWITTVVFWLLIYHQMRSYFPLVIAIDVEKVKTAPTFVLTNTDLH